MAKVPLTTVTFEATFDTIAPSPTTRVLSRSTTPAVTRITTPLGRSVLYPISHQKPHQKSLLSAATIVNKGRVFIFSPTPTATPLGALNGQAEKWPGAINDGTDSACCFNTFHRLLESVHLSNHVTKKQINTSTQTRGRCSKIDDCTTTTV